MIVAGAEDSVFRIRILSDPERVNGFVINFKDPVPQPGTESDVLR
jgi:hypothetical protein